MASPNIERAKYLEQSKAAEVFDRLVGEVLEAQPQDLAKFLGDNAARVAEAVLSRGGGAAAAPSATTRRRTSSVTGSTAMGKGNVSPSLPMVTELAEHHLSSWKKGAQKTGMLDEEQVNKIQNPMEVHWPHMPFQGPHEQVIGEVLTNDSCGRDGMTRGLSGGFVRAGATRKIWWDPKSVRAGIVTCGGLCPGLNSIVREVTRCLRHCYGVDSVTGFRSGYNGMRKPDEYPPIRLTTETCRDIHQKGGSLIEAGRGGFNPDALCDTLHSHGINLLFVVGGDGTQWAADVLVQAAQERNLPVSVVGIPKSIDNDVCFFDRTFGFETAVQAGCVVIRHGHVEASSCHNGVAVVKLMGRDAGFVARNAALASTLADAVLIPEVDWKLQDLLDHVVATLRRKHHMVIVVAEGAGQEHVATGKLDSTGHTVYGDIGKFLVDKINSHLKGSIGGRCFYIDPSYIIRSGPAEPNDHMYCARMAYESVHAAMRGYTGVCVGSVNGFMVMVPMKYIAGARRMVKPTSSIWQACVQSAKMPATLAGLSGKVDPQSLVAIQRKKERGHPSMYRAGGACAGSAT
eukprot:TRINITY_DN150_c0_g3_i1.p1 TRINITY_DN150_c0_g3~~TRINITY_DN150_c0_g3_i1.p1  ORF type:complete len:608 (+),score=175.83 TRINITY_DN150_c0_g3_i1:110-1825(+)